MCTEEQENAFSKLEKDIWDVSKIMRMVWDAGDPRICDSNVCSPEMQFGAEKWSEYSRQYGRRGGGEPGEGYGGCIPGTSYCPGATGKDDNDIIVYLKETTLDFEAVVIKADKPKGSSSSEEDSSSDNSSSSSQNDNKEDEEQKQSETPNEPAPTQSGGTGGGSGTPKGGGGSSGKGTGGAQTGGSDFWNESPSSDSVTSSGLNSNNTNTPADKERGTSNKDGGKEHNNVVVPGTNSIYDKAVYEIGRSIRVGAGFGKLVGNSRLGWGKAQEVELPKQPSETGIVVPEGYFFAQRGEIEEDVDAGVGLSGKAKQKPGKAGEKRKPNNGKKGYSKITGDPKAIEAFLKILNKFLEGYARVRINPLGQLSLDLLQGFPRPPPNIAKMIQILQDLISIGKINLDLAYNDWMLTLSDPWGGRLDMKEIEEFGADEPLSAGSALAHELVEQLYMQGYGYDGDTAHAIATDMEQLINGGWERDSEKPKDELELFGDMVLGASTTYKYTNRDKTSKVKTSYDKNGNITNVRKEGNKNE